MLSVALPTAGANLLQNSAGVAITFMVASLGDTAVAAVSSANRFFFIFFLLLFGIVSGASVLSAQYWGRRDTRAIAQTAGIMLRFSISAGLLFSAAAILFPQQILMVFTGDPEVVMLGASYLRMKGLILFTASFSQAYWTFLRSVEKAGLGLAVQLLSCVFSISLSAVFTFGLFGAPRMGVNGSALGLLIARLLEFIVIFIYAGHEKTLRLRLHHIIPFLGKTSQEQKNLGANLLQDFYRLSGIVVLNEIFWGLGTSLQGAIIGHISTQAIAAFSFAQAIQGAVTVFVFGSAMAASVICGKSVGRGDFATARRQSKLFLLFSFLVGLFCCGLQLVSRALLIGPVASSGLLNLSAEALRLVGLMMLLEAAIIPFAACNCTIVVGLLRGGGDIKYSSIYDVAFLWAYALPAAAAGAFAFGLSPVTVLLILRMEEVIKFFFGIVRVLGWKWMKNVTRESKEPELTVTV